MESKNQFRAIDFFCGGGGMTCGLRQVGIDVIAGVDFDIDAKETYEHNNSQSTFIQADIKRLRSNFLKESLQLNIMMATLFLWDVVHVSTIA